MRTITLSLFIFLAMASFVWGADGAGIHAYPAWWFLGTCLAIGSVIWFVGSKKYCVVDRAGQPVLDEHEKPMTLVGHAGELSAPLLFGALVAQFWVHGNPAEYHATMHHVLFYIPIAHVAVTPHFIVNDIFMMLFFGLAAGELAEAFLAKEGKLRGMKGMLPMAGCVGGVVGPALVYLRLCTPGMEYAWPVPCATDIAFAWLGARQFLPRRHPAVLFLLALAIADDFVGMAIIAIKLPQHDPHLLGFVILAVGIGIAVWLRIKANRKIALQKRRKQRMEFPKWYWYTIPTAVCWCGLLYAGLHTALALVFVIPFMPMTGTGLFDPTEEKKHKPVDTVKSYEHTFKGYVDAGLFFFGLSNAGVQWFGVGAWNQNSNAVFFGLGVGKFFGITICTVLCYLLLRFMGRFRLPDGKSWFVGICNKMLAGFDGVSLPQQEKTGEIMRWKHVPIMSVLAAMGFTVALFVTDAAGGDPALKLGSLASSVYLVLGIMVGKIFCRGDHTVSPAKASAST